jgi:hypothetical protein
MFGGIMKYFPISYINSKEETELLVEMILSYKKDYVKEFLKEKKLAYSFLNKKELKKGLLGYIEKEKLQKKELVELLDNIEEFGNQHVYFYDNSSQYITELKDENFIKNILEEKKLTDLYNNFKPIIIPQKREITSISHNEKSFKIKWVEKRTKKEFIDEQIKEDKLLQTWQLHAKRAINTFKVDLITGNSELTIQRLPTGFGYDLVRDEYFKMLSDIIDLSTFSPITFRSAIKKLDDEPMVKRSGIKFSTVDDGEISFRSQNNKRDYKSSPSLKGARDGLGDNITGKYGNFYWLPDGTISNRIHTHVYPNRIGILGEYEEKELNYVFSRIRSFAK